MYLLLVVGPDGVNLTVGTETSDTTIRDVVQTQVSENFGILFKDEDVVARGRKLNLGEDFLPFSLLKVTAGAEASFNRGSRSLVTSEVVGIDIETTERTREAKLKDSPKHAPSISKSFCIP